MGSCSSLCFPGPEPAGHRSGRLQDYINPNSGTVVMACFPSLAEFAPELIVRYLSETNRVGVRLQFNQEATFMQLPGQAAGRGDRPALLY